MNEKLEKMKLVRCLEKRYINFTYGKIYEAIPFAIKGKHNEPCEFRIIDDEEDFYTIAVTTDSILKNWEWAD